MPAQRTDWCTHCSRVQPLIFMAPESADKLHLELVGVPFYPSLNSILIPACPVHTVLSPFETSFSFTSTINTIVTIKHVLRSISLVIQIIYLKPVLLLIPQERLMGIIIPVFCGAGNDLCPLYLTLKSFFWLYMFGSYFLYLNILKCLFSFCIKALLLTSLLITLISFPQKSFVMSAYIHMDIFVLKSSCFTRKYPSVDCYALIFLSTVCFCSHI